MSEALIKAKVCRTQWPLITCDHCGMTYIWAYVNTEKKSHRFLPQSSKCGRCFCPYCGWEPTKREE